jgi:predicted flap endonuclease-1-like 5' DNA nuclease
MTEKSRKYYFDNIDKIKARQKETYYKNHEEIRKKQNEYFKSYYEKNKEKFKQPRPRKKKNIPSDNLTVIF